MPRRREVPKREILPDPKFNDRLVAKFITTLMLDGKRSTAEKIVYGAFDLLEERGGEQPIRAPDRENIYEIMSKPIVSVDPQMDIRYCARLLDQFGLSVVPVIENELVIGVVGYVELVLEGLRG